MADNSFFEEQKEQSLVKSTIVAKYFESWSNVIISAQKQYPHHTQKISYIEVQEDNPDHIGGAYDVCWETTSRKS
jgi:hypothetical protein